jgi:hypothetical protein
VQAAVFDAVNGIDGHYTAIHVPPAAPPGASKRAAAVQAAYATLVNLFPNQKLKFDLQRAASLAAITEPTTPPSRDCHGVKGSPMKYGLGEARTGFPMHRHRTWAEPNPASGGQLRRPWRQDWCRS